MNHPPFRAPRFRVGFLGSGAIAIPALHTLVDSPLVELLFVGTQPDRPAGRNRRLMPTPVGAWCDSRGLACDRVTSARRTAFIDRLRLLALDVLIVFAFGQILRRPLLELPAHGCLNIHASLLPRHRGASPIQAAILAGDAATGIAFMAMAEGLDTGPVYSQTTLPLLGNETAATLENDLASLAGISIMPALIDILSHDRQPSPQDDAVASYAPRIRKEDGRIDWQLPAATIERRVRAFSPWPGSWFVLPSESRSQRIEVTAAVVHPECAPALPGTIVQADKSRWLIATACGNIEILRCKPEGKRDMSGVEFIRGARPKQGLNVSQDEAPTDQL